MPSLWITFQHPVEIIENNGILHVRCAKTFTKNYVSIKKCDIIDYSLILSKLIYINLKSNVEIGLDESQITITSNIIVYFSEKIFKIINFVSQIEELGPLEGLNYCAISDKETADILINLFTNLHISINILRYVDENQFLTYDILFNTAIFYVLIHLARSASQGSANVLFNIAIVLKNITSSYPKSIFPIQIYSHLRNIFLKEKLFGPLTYFDIVILKSIRGNPLPLTFEEITFPDSRNYVFVEYAFNLEPQSIIHAYVSIAHEWFVEFISNINISDPLVSKSFEKSSRIVSKKLLCSNSDISFSVVKNFLLEFVLPILSQSELLKIALDSPIARQIFKENPESLHSRGITSHEFQCLSGTSNATKNTGQKRKVEIVSTKIETASTKEPSTKRIERLQPPKSSKSNAGGRKIQDQTIRIASKTNSKEFSPITERVQKPTTKNPLTFTNARITITPKKNDIKPND